MYKEFMIIFSLIIIHELGHLSASLIFKWNLDKICIYPFGGCVKFNEKLNKPLYEEFLILISGPMTQMLYFLIICVMFDNNLISYRNYLLFKNYNFALLFFNLLPIYPLDGGKILNIVLNYIFPFKKGNKIAVYVSFLFIVFILFKSSNTNLTCMVLVLFYEVFIYLRRQDYLYNRFLLERYLDKFNFKKVKTIKGFNNFYKDSKHVIKKDNKYVTEKEYLKGRFGVKL